MVKILSADEIWQKIKESIKFELRRMFQRRKIPYNAEKDKYAFNIKGTLYFIKFGKEKGEKCQEERP